MAKKRIRSFIFCFVIIPRSHVFTPGEQVFDLSDLYVCVLIQFVTDTNCVVPICQMPDNGGENHSKNVVAIWIIHPIAGGQQTDVRPEMPTSVVKPLP
jgi:hypothetical protein